MTQGSRICKQTEAVSSSGVILKNMGSADENRIPEMNETDVASTILARDYKGLGNYSSNGVLEIRKWK